MFNVKDHTILAVNTSSLPKDPDRKKANKILIDLQNNTIKK